MFMDRVYSTKRGSYEVSLCTIDDIDEHYALVEAKVASTPQMLYVENMHKSIENSTAYKVTTDGKLVGFLYLYMKDSIWYGASIYSSDTLAMVVLMVEISTLIGFVPIRFTPHDGMINEYKALLDGSSIRGYRSGRSYVLVRMRSLEDKFAQFFKYFGVSV